jgi:hypothetical protein
MIEIVRTLDDGRDRFVLRRRHGALELVLGNVVLLSSAALETERAFGHLAKGARRVLVGGLGFGATLRGVLEVAREDAEIVVVEKLSAVVDVARNEAAGLLAGALDDPRVVLEQGDVAAVLDRSRDLSAILLDVDNGPEWASFRENARLYTPEALTRARAALAGGGLYAVWSGYPCDAFLARLRAAGFSPRLELLHERGRVRARAYVGISKENV